VYLASLSTQEQEELEQFGKALIAGSSISEDCVLASRDPNGDIACSTPSQNDAHIYCTKAQICYSLVHH